MYIHGGINLYKGNTMTENNQEIIDNKLRWQNRRRMAWLCLISMILITFVILFTDWCPESRLKILAEVITWYYFTTASIIGAYMGFTTWASRR